MSIKNAVADRKAEALGPKVCKLGRLVLVLEGTAPEEHAALVDAITLVRTVGAPLYTHQWLTDILNANQYHMGKTVVSEHCRGVCTCDPGQ